MQYSKTALNKFLLHFKDVFSEWQGNDEIVTGEISAISACNDLLLSVQLKALDRIGHGGRPNVIHLRYTLHKQACLAYMPFGPRFADPLNTTAHDVIAVLPLTVCYPD